MLQKREQAPKCGSNEEEKETLINQVFVKLLILYNFTTKCFTLF
jgi:hypothetical protein